jgi:branched-chain amino acid transport system ATP-binding protein
MLEVKDLHAGYGGGEVLAGLSLSIAAGEIVALLGRNGMGKTTLLRTLMGLVKPASGHILFDGQDLSRLESFEIARLGLAYVPQGREIFGALTVSENIRLGARSPAAVARAFALFPALAPKADDAAGGLSGGQQQQLAIARALAMEPKLLLLDEPSEGIQPNVVQEIARIVVKAAREAGIAVLVVEQNTTLALAMADRVVFLEAGATTGDFPAQAVTEQVLQEQMGL